MAEMTVDLVAVERKIWSGRATFVKARTTVGEIGILPGHQAMLAQLEEAGVVRVDGADGTSTTLAVHGGFLSVTAETVTVLAEFAEVSEEIDVARARAARDRADTSTPEGAAAAAIALLDAPAADATEVRVALHGGAEMFAVRLEIIETRFFASCGAMDRGRSARSHRPAYLEARRIS